MPRLRTELSVQTCMEILREQMSPLTVRSKYKFGPTTSRVFGRIEPPSFILESSADIHSKRFVGHLTTQAGITIINYRWLCGFGHRIFGHGDFDEQEILGFLQDWLKTTPV